jgi:hypothetical protein
MKKSAAKKLSRPKKPAQKLTSTGKIAILIKPPYGISPEQLRKL